MKVLLTERLVFMKLYLINSVFYIFMFSNIAQANEYLSEYSVSTSGIKIGKFSWSIVINENEYVAEIKLKNFGLLSNLYKFEGSYISKGIINNKKNFESKYYRQIWKTKKKTKVVHITFDRRVVQLRQEPEEFEFSRINIDSLFDYFDPITSFINILNGMDKAKTIDGRRIYIMKVKNDKDSQNIVLKIDEYKNIWADHKRNDLERIEFILDEVGFLPISINIHFKERVFKLNKV